MLLGCYQGGREIGHPGTLSYRVHRQTPWFVAKTGCRIDGWIQGHEYPLGGARGSEVRMCTGSRRHHRDIDTETLAANRLRRQRVKVIHTARVGYLANMDFKGRFALVTGAGSGIGRAAALLLARRGAAVAAVAHSQESADEVVAAIRRSGGIAEGFAVELSDPDSVTALYDQVARRWGRLDIVIANAGINGVWAPLGELTVEEWDRTLSVNLTGTFLTVTHALPLLRASGRAAVVITSSVNGTRNFSNAGASAYSVSKAGQVAFAKMAAVELAEDGIRVNAICPGSIDTEIDDNTEQRNTDDLGPVVEYPDGQIPLTGNQPGSSEQVAELICFLSSDAASHITGTEIWIDGGQSLLVG
ncbi:MAG: SDR family oxidoreductase, partial [Propionibacteriaceae bacterium]|nr:SDR family oxidoreductase [Propionibacteriaceae bacterium]